MLEGFLNIVFAFLIIGEFEKDHYIRNGVWLVEIQRINK